MTTYKNMSKGYKLAFSVWILLAILAFIFTLVLSLSSFNKSYTAFLDIQGRVHIGEIYKYSAKIEYKSLLFRKLDSISSITTLATTYIKGVQKEDISNFQNEFHHIYFDSPKKLEVGNLATFSYKVSYLKAYKNLLVLFISGLIIIFIVSKVASSFKQKVYELVTKPKFLKLFILSVIIYLVALSALLRGDVYYINDFGRSIGLGDNWTGFSRYISLYLYTLIDSFKVFPYTDISPLPQLFAIVILSLSGILLAYIVRKKLDILGIIATLPLGLSPYFLENLSYKFDSPLMSFSLFILLVPFLFKDNLKHFIYISFIALLLSLSTYQASNGIYIILTLFFIFTNLIYKEKSLKEILQFLFAAVITFIVAILFYRYFIVTPVPLSLSGYVSSNTMQATKILEGGNLKIYLSFIFSDLKSLPFFTFLVVSALLFILTSMLLGKRNFIVSFIASLVFLALALSLSYGAYLALQNALFAPRAFIGFGGFASLVFLGVLYKSKFRFLKGLSIVFVALGSYSLVVFASSYGNAISAQQSYMMYRAGLVAKDLSALVPREAQNKVGVALEGSIGYSPVTLNFIDRYYGGIAKRLIPNVMINKAFPFTNYPLIYQGSNYQSFYGSACAPENTYIKDSSAKKELLLDNSYQSIYKSNSCYFVDLKPSTWNPKKF
ncbi:hypothetical protein BKH43_01570 [Helicobacter sp. 13S00401-1]|uniref:glucosyltransferase domain-containing protein n=1 Tax=Helicobacter sp. 13S00401-1 TaxID=1905758 RepID=UPI000BA7C8A8|nr:glucosyltransferase domain-containing protein [Helicobacter sp. 13S00401-1]PAF51355.1 hypothetical protein BKH43_01570 [Helicobacter sp. 13S00401-1]